MSTSSSGSTSRVSGLLLLPYAEEIIEYQEGFQRGRSTVGQIFTVRQILEKCWEENIAVHNLFTDFQTAHDTVWKKECGVKSINQISQTN